MRDDILFYLIPYYLFSIFNNIQLQTRDVPRKCLEKIERLISNSRPGGSYTAFISRTQYEISQRIYRARR